jgi:hypothetical protein
MPVKLKVMIVANPLKHVFRLESNHFPAFVPMQLGLADGRYGDGEGLGNRADTSTRCCSPGVVDVERDRLVERRAGRRYAVIAVPVSRNAAPLLMVTTTLVSCRLVPAKVTWLPNSLKA